MSEDGALTITNAKKEGESVGKVGKRKVVEEAEGSGQVAVSHKRLMVPNEGLSKSQ